MERTFAGFWRDGAKVLPEYRHADATGYVIRFSKSKKEFSCCHAMRPSVWSEFYWLDTTTPTELAPQEAFELLKTITPTLERIEKPGKLFFVFKDWISIINWGDTTEYPPKQKWRVPTDADKGKRCRFRDHVDKDWTEIESAKFMCTWRDGFMVEYITGSPASWKYCEVLDE